MNTCYNVIIPMIPIILSKSRLDRLVVSVQRAIIFSSKKLTIVTKNLKIYYLYWANDLINNNCNIALYL